MKLKDVDGDMQERICDMMNRTWDIIGDDALRANDGKDMPRSHVIEIVLDADHCLTHGDDKEAYKTLEELSYADKMVIARKAFRCARYGF